MTLYKILESELQKKGLNEFINEKGELVYFDNEYQFIRKIMAFDDDVYDIVNNVFFLGYTFDDDAQDRDFKESFTHLFLNREIKYQSVEVFGMKVYQVTKLLKGYINDVYQKLDDYILNKTVITGEDSSNKESESDGKQKTIREDTSKDESLSKTDGTNVNQNRDFKGTLPDSQLNLNLNQDTLSYGGENTISKNSGTTDTETVSESLGNNTGESETTDNKNSKESQSSRNQSEALTYNIDTLELKKVMHTSIFSEYDKECFIHVW